MRVLFLQMTAQVEPLCAFQSEINKRTLNFQGKSATMGKMATSN
jgi:hypothetical protein